MNKDLELVGTYVRYLEQENNALKHKQYRIQKFLKLCDVENSAFHKKMKYYDMTEYCKNRIQKILDE